VVEGAAGVFGRWKSFGESDDNVRFVFAADPVASASSDDSCACVYGCVTGRPELSAPLRLIWFAAPVVFSQAHAGTDYVTTHRVLTYDRMCRDAMTKIGVPILDAAMLTQSRWEAAYDGVHYLSGSNDNWNGHVSWMVFHAAMNVLFPKCGSSDTTTVAADVYGDLTAADPVDKHATGAAAAEVPKAAVSSAVVSTAGTSSAAVAASSSASSSLQSTPSAAPGTATRQRPFAACWQPPSSPYELPKWSADDEPLYITVAGVRYAVDLPVMEDCISNAVTFTPEKAGALKDVTDANSVGLVVTLVMWTSVEGTGEPCGALSPVCASLTHRLTLHIGDSDGTRIIYGALTPDPSVRHYMFVVQVSGASRVVVASTCVASLIACSSCTVQGVDGTPCLNTPVLKSKPFSQTESYAVCLPEYVGHEPPNTRRPLVESCFPVLYL
jgi:hypothetical protein